MGQLHRSVLGEVEIGKWTDAHTCDILESQVHAIVVHWADGCIMSYQLLTATLFILPNSLYLLI